MTVENTIAYWVGVAEMALEILLMSDLETSTKVEEAKAAHKDAMEHLMRIAQHFYYVDFSKYRSDKPYTDPGVAE